MTAPEYKLIHAHVFDPSRSSLFVKHKKSDAAEYHTVVCSSSASCQLFAQGQCAARRFMGGGCPYGHAQVEHGPSQRAKGFYMWINAHKATEKEVGCLAAPPAKLARVGDMMYLPYSFMDMVISGGYEKPNPFSKEKGFVPFSEFTPEFVARMCNGRPQALFGGEIYAYQRESVPAFVAHLEEEYPELLEAAALLSLRIKALTQTLTKVGRKALLRTLVPNVGTFEGFTWDGVYMVCTDRRAMPPFTKFDAQEMRVLPAENAVVTVTDNAQCSKETVFKD